MENKPLNKDEVVAMIANLRTELTELVKGEIKGLADLIAEGSSKLSATEESLKKAISDRAATEEVLKNLQSKVEAINADREKAMANLRAKAEKVVNDPNAPEAAKNEAREFLGLTPPPAPGTVPPTTATTNPPVAPAAVAAVPAKEGFWNRAKTWFKGWWMWLTGGLVVLAGGFAVWRYFSLVGASEVAEVAIAA